MSQDWNWYDDEHKESLVVKSVRAVAVYTNVNGEIVIRQEGIGYGDSPDDAVVVVPLNAVPALIKALKAEAARE